MPTPLPPLIGALLGGPIEAVELREGEPADPLLPAEAALLDEVVESRRRHFAAGRHCAHRALERLGVPDAQILVGPDRAPLWPEGIVGSITHCETYAAAAVARRDDVAALGIDAEPHAPLPEGVPRLVVGEAERDWLESAGGSTCWDRVLFSAKESVFKAWSPLTDSWLGFKDAEVSLSPRDGTFRARLLVPGPEVAGGPLTRLDGRFAVHDGLVLTAVAVEGRRAPRVSSACASSA
jgi:4'-phosphopantetheinyl transferase EntD